MSKRFLPKVVLIIMIVCMICATSMVVMAEPDVKAATPKSAINIMHITDIHYIPEYYCYQGKLEENDFATKIKGDPKLMLESYAILERTVEMIEEAKVVPDYVFLTGDITSNGEKQSLIDVANAMRAMQNRMRKKNPNFQVLVVPGNHDVFNNRHASFYDMPDGKKVAAPIASRTEFIKIFASLGYPDLTDAEAKEFYDSIPQESWEKDYWTAEGKHLPYTPVTPGVSFVNSTTREGLNFRYYKDEQTYENAEWTENSLGGLTYLMTDEKNKVSVLGFDTTLSVKNDQRTEGEYTRGNVEWFVDNAASLKGYTNICMGHHNIVPHFTVQEQYLQAFVTYGWEEVAEALASNGMNYVFTGHLHANDVENYVSFNNNTMYDIETGATISQGAAIREVRIDDFGEGKQNLVSNTIPVDKADLSYLRGKGLVPAKYNDCFIEGDIVDVQKFIDAKLFSPYLENMIDSFISTTKIYAKIDSMKPMEINLGISKITLDVKEIVYTLLEEINTKTLKDYTYRGDVDSLKLTENKVIGYVHELLSGAIHNEVTAGHSFNDLVLYAYGAHLMGAEVDSPDKLPDWVKDAMDGFRNGENMDMVLDALLWSDNGIYNLIDKLAKTPLDLTKCTNSLPAIKMLVKTLKLDVNLNAVVLDTLVPEVLKNDVVKGLIGTINLKGDTLMESVDIIIGDFLDHDLKTGIGGVLCNIATSFAVDSTSFDGAFDKPYTHKVNSTDAYSMMGAGKAIIEPTIANGRMPGQLTVTFGKDPSADRNFVWFTSQFAPQGNIQYRKQGDTKWMTELADSRLMPYAYTMTDFGIFASSIDKNIMRHNVRLTKLDAGTTYEYRVGDTSREVWTEVGTFKTAPKVNGAFEVAILSDLQGMSREHYEDVSTMLDASSKIYNIAPSFTINLGDIVYSGKNSDEWGYALDIPANYWRNTTSLVIAGNRDGKEYTSGKVKERKKAVNVDIEEMTYDPVSFHYDFGGATLDSRQYFSLDYSGVHFIMLDTNDLDKSETKLSGNQLNWLKTDLKNTKLAHKVVLMHKGMYSNGIHAGDNDTLGLRKQLAPIFYENKVDLVLSGHDNVYSETPRINAEGKAAEDGVKYVNIAGLTSNNVEMNTESVAMSAEKQEVIPTMTMGVLSYDGEADKITYQGYAMQGEKLVKVEDYNASADKPSAPKNNTTSIIIVCVLVGVAIIGAVVFGIVSKKRSKKNAD